MYVYMNVSVFTASSAKHSYIEDTNTANIQVGKWLKLK